MTQKTTKSDINTFVTKLDLIFNKEVFFSGGFIRAITALDKDITDYDRHKVETYLSDTDEIISDYSNFIHQWFPANPNKKIIIDRCNELYIDKITSRDRYNSFPRRKIANNIIEKNDNAALQVFNIERILRKNKYVVVEGRKGVGKTTFFNYWLNNRSQYLEKVEKKIWFRVDASKLYGIWTNFTENDDFTNIDLDVFHKAHAIYVTAKYADPDGKSSAFFQTWNYILDIALEDEDLFSFIEDIEEAVKNSFNAPDGRDTERFFDWVLKNGHLQSICRVYDYCNQYWLDQGYKIVFIVDGVDNISWTRETTTYYDHFCKELGRLFLSDYRKEFCDFFENIILVVRPETFRDIETKSLADHLNVDTVRKYYRCLVAPTCTYSILEHKANVFESPMSEAISSFKEKSLTLIEEDDLIDKTDTNFSFKIESSNFKDFSRNYIDNLMDAIRSRYLLLDKYYSGKDYITSFEIDDFEDVSQIIEIIFNDNIRACVDNFLKNYATIKLAESNKIPGATDKSRYPQYLLLNGRIFLDSPNIQTRVRGEAYPNLFWWNPSWVKNNTSHWYGLCVIRILQLLNNNSEIKLSLLHSVMITIFSCDKKLIERQIDRLIQYGLIQYSNSITLKNNDYLVSSTKKGKFILEYTFMFTDWLYFCALDTPIVQDFAQEKDSRYIKIHRDLKYDLINTFNEAYITTVITFCRHIYSQQKLDMKKISNTWKDFENENIQSGLFRSENHAKFIFSFPDHFEYFVKRDIKYLFFGLLKRDKNQANMLMNDLIGLYPEILNG